jgi:hypothetical protein
MCAEDSPNSVKRTDAYELRPASPKRLGSGNELLGRDKSELATYIWNSPVHFFSPVRWRGRGCEGKQMAVVGDCRTRNKVERRGGDGMGGHLLSKPESGLQGRLHHDPGLRLEESQERSHPHL